MPAYGDDRTLGTLFTELTQETSALVRKEVELAKAEMSEKIDQAQSGLVSLAIGGAVLYAGFLVLLFAIAGALGKVFDQPWATPWLAPLIVAVVVLVIGFILLQRGRSNVKATHFIPRRTVDSLRRDRQFARAQVQ